MIVVNKTVASINGVKKYEGAKEYIIYELPFSEIKTFIEIDKNKLKEAESLRVFKKDVDVEVKTESAKGGVESLEDSFDEGDGDADDDEGYEVDDDGDEEE